MTRHKSSTIAIAALAAVVAFSTAAPATVDPSAVSSAVTTAIAGANSGGPSAITEAIKTATETQLHQFGPADAKAVLSDIISDAMAGGATPQEIGQALAEAALELGAPFSDDIAEAVGASGDSETLAAFDATVAASPGGARLAEVADANFGKNTPAGPLGVGAVVSVGGGVSGAGVGANGSGCVETSPNECN